MNPVSLDALDLAALLCSRVCHDVISPVGAIVNGLEVLEDEKDPSMREFAQELIAKSARQASARLQLCRIAFGAAGSAGAEIDTGDAEQVARNFFSDDKTRLDWSGPRLLLPKNRVKLLLNVLLIAATAIPRGGQLNVEVGPEGRAFTVRAQGVNARIPPHAEELIAGAPASGSVDAHAIQPYYAGLIARAAGMAVAFAIHADVVTINVTPAG
ncbi:histidine phosphotransferase [Camelimonas fluminis]|uniref:Histidine phosphotransferase ChpT n=1 Tax=Camelimonas fluminis TaxID=1576911 RepID=A0ABV7UHT0_9HYPH|nr:histidine phosphotransferase family protein [Camelimonas fluminis]GHE69683.1 histidine phosphotransferase [Camelimonas fluminis]